MNIMILGAAGFIGTNLTFHLTKNLDDTITLVGRNAEHFCEVQKYDFPNVVIKNSSLDNNTDLYDLIKGQDILYHLVSTTIPITSNQHISQELQANVVFSANLFEACVKSNVKRVVFISSGGTVYGKEENCPLNENMQTSPISSYGIQKITIEKLLYLYNYMYGLDYRIVRLANPYGPYQRPNGKLGAVTTFTYKALKGEKIIVYGDGSIVRDFIYIDDAIRAMLNIVNGESQHHVFNIGCGYGTSIKDLLDTIQHALGQELSVIYKRGREVDVPINYLDITRYEKYYGKLKPLSLYEGIKKTAEFMRKHYELA